MPILIVDDEPEIRQLLREVLVEEGYTVAHATNGREALSYLQTASTLPCVIILDLMMPIMSGWDFLQVQQHDPQLALIPIVVISAAHGRTMAAALGVQSALDKPFDLDRFLATVQHYCRRAPLHDRAAGSDKKGAR